MKSVYSGLSAYMEAVHTEHSCSTHRRALNYDATLVPKANTNQQAW